MGGTFGQHHIPWFVGWIVAKKVVFFGFLGLELELDGSTT